jgi:hypothetical protein
MASASSTDRPVSIDRDPTTEVGDIDYIISLGPIQPRGTEFKGTDVLVSGRLKRLHFQESWFMGRPWLEYSFSQDAACCFYCRLFKPKVNGK